MCVDGFYPFPFTEIEAIGAELETRRQMFCDNPRPSCVFYVLVKKATASFEASQDITAICHENFNLMPFCFVITRFSSIVIDRDSKKTKKHRIATTD